MYTAFLALNQEKQKKIINAAMKELANKGYKNASTNNIVIDADISKGSLFHYFHSKKGMADFLIRYSCDVFIEKILKNMEDMTGDIIRRWRDIILLKLDLICEYPLIFEFMLCMLNEEAEDIQGCLAVSREEFLIKFKKKLYTGIDYSMFREDVDVDKVLKLIYWGLEGYAGEVQAQTGTGPISPELRNRWLQESDDYMDIIKKAFYKQREVLL